MRLIAGKLRSRRLCSLRGADIRPTSDPLRETLFNVLTAGNPDALAGSTWVDLYAGTGAVGIEAVSRGAAKVYFVEVSSTAVKIIHENLKSLQITGRAEVIQADVENALGRLQSSLAATPDFVFLDPPYRLEHAYRDTLNRVGRASWMATTTIVVAEHVKKLDPGERFGSLERFRRLQQGDAILSFYRLAGASEVERVGEAGGPSGSVT